MTSIPRGPNGTPGWLIKVDRKTGNLLGYVDSIGSHGMEVLPMEVLPNGEAISTSPARGEMPYWYRLIRGQ